MDQLINVAFGVIAVIIGFFLIYALMLGLKQLGAQFRSIKAAKKVTLSPEEAAEVREAIDAYRLAKKAEKAANAQA